MDLDDKQLEAIRVAGIDPDEFKAAEFRNKILIFTRDGIYELKKVGLLRCLVRWAKKKFFEASRAMEW